MWSVLRLFDRKGLVVWSVFRLVDRKGLVVQWRRKLCFGVGAPLLMLATQIIGTRPKFLGQDLVHNNHLQCTV